MPYSVPTAARVETRYALGGHVRKATPISDEEGGSGQREWTPASGDPTKERPDRGCPPRQQVNTVARRETIGLARLRFLGGPGDRNTRTVRERLACATLDGPTPRWFVNRGQWAATARGSQMKIISDSRGKSVVVPSVRPA